MSIWWIKLVLLLSITVGVTWLILWVLAWTEKNKTTYPELSRKKSALKFVIWLVLSCGEFPK